VSDQHTVAVLGTGIMGAPMAGNIARAGFPTRVWNRTRDKAEPLAEAGAGVADSPAEAVDGADIVVTMLADGGAVESVMTDGGALEAMRDDAIWLQTSTVGIAAIERLAQLAEQRGVTFVDAPVVGTKQPAEQGKLTVLASGPPEALDACTPVFEAIGGNTRRLGEAGAATRLKLVINNWLLGVVENLAETIAFAEGIDVPPETFLEAIDGSAVGAPYAQLKGKQMLDREFPAAFPLSLALKDARLVLEAAERHGVPSKLAKVAADQFERAEQLGHGDEDMAAVYYASADGA
jgi:3-hydroxyisobutyrate dehydrogenase